MTLETLGINIDGIAPAGAISSTALDMTSWLRFLLRQGVQDGKALISPAALTTTWTPQIQVGGTIGYGMGWFVRNWQGQRLIEHGGAIAGYSAEVGLLPDSNIGFVVLTNTLSALPSIAMQLVPQYLLGELPPAASDVGDLKPYLGRYIANFATFSNEVFTISERNGRLVLDIPSQVESALNPPRADGRWSLVKTDQTRGVVRPRQDGQGRGAEDPRGRSGSSRSHAKASCSRRRSRSASCRSTWAAIGDAAGANEFAILIRNQRLAVRLPNNTSFDLLPPDATGRRATRANVGLGVTFEESPTGAVSAMNFHRPGALPVMRLTPVASTLPTVDEIMKLRRIPAASAVATMRTTGSVRFPQSGVEGRFSSSTAGDDRLRTDLDLDGSVQIRTVLNKGRASAAVSGAPSRELTGKQLAQTRLGHPVGALRRLAQVLRRRPRGARRCARRAKGLWRPARVGRSASRAGEPWTRRPATCSRRSRRCGLPRPVRCRSTTTYSDYREVGGMRVPHRYIESTEMGGRTIFQVERVEVGVELAPDTFTLQPLTVSGGGR